MPAWRRSLMRRLALALGAASLLPAATTTGTALAAAPPFLSQDHARVDISSTYGSGSFGTWFTDQFGLPAYRYTLDELTAPQAKQPELAGSTDAWHQVGNDHIVADAFNHGYVQLWSQDRDYEWMNYYNAPQSQYAGGYGYLNIGGHTISTLYDDRPAGTAAQREFGPGYFRTQLTVDGLDVTQLVYAPFGDDPLLLHDVTLRNTTSSPITASWFEYWGVNPYEPGSHTNRALAVPSYDPSTQTLSVAQLPTALDTSPLSIYASALQGPVSGFDTSVPAFFGSGARANPAAVAADRTSQSLAPPSLPGVPSQTLFAFRSPVTVAPGKSITLRYAYGYGHPQEIAPVLARYRAMSDPLSATKRAWSAWLPQVSFGPRYAWLSRELQWNAYMVRSGATYEECAGHHILSQGGYYQYGFGFQGAFRDPLQHMLPMIYTDPYLAREVLLYSAGEQPANVGAVPYARLAFCQRFDLGTSDDLDLWLLYATAEYVLATRDFGFLNQQVPYAGGGTGSFWDHLKLAYFHQEDVIGHGPHGGYITGATGDWSDFSTVFLQMTESMLPTAQLAYIYPLFATVADAYGDHAFAAQLRSSGAADLATLHAQWTGRGWYSRGYSGTRQLGQGAIFGEPQPWAILAGAPSAPQAGTLVANVRRFLDGIGAPAVVHGPTKIGASLTPAYNDPDVTERSSPSGGVGDNNSNFVGGVWFAINGTLAWALGTLEGVVPHATSYAWDEFVRNTLATHATAFPDAWDGLISVDDTCWSYYSSHPDECGNGLNSSYDTQILHQPAWSLFDAIKLAGIDPTAQGYRIDPHLPMGHFSLRLPLLGVDYGSRSVRGYLRPEAGGNVLLDVRIPPGAPASRLITWVDRRRVAHRVRAGFAEFRLSLRGGAADDWALTWGRAARRSPGHHWVKRHRSAPHRPAGGPGFTG